MPNLDQPPHIGACDTDLDALLRRGRQLQAEAMRAFVTGLARGMRRQLHRLIGAPAAGLRRGGPNALKRPSRPPAAGLDEDKRPAVDRRHFSTAA